MRGCFEPFGTDHQAGTEAGASESGVFLRLPGQWDDEVWAEATLGAGLYYNVHRWYGYDSGRYLRLDPLGQRGVSRDYGYVTARPLTLRDRIGLVPDLPGCAGWSACDSPVEPDSDADHILKVYNDLVSLGQQSPDDEVRTCYRTTLAASLSFIRCAPGDECKEEAQAQGFSMFGGFTYRKSHYKKGEPRGINLCPRAPGAGFWRGCDLARKIAHEIGHFCTDKPHGPESEPWLTAFNLFMVDQPVYGSSGRCRQQ